MISQKTRPLFNLLALVFLMLPAFSWGGIEKIEIGVFGMS